MDFSTWLSSSEGKEDIFKMSKDAVKIRKLLSHWNEQHDYMGPSWDGILKLHKQLVKGTMEAAFESAGWYKYKSSKKTNEMDGKDWRIILTEFNPLVVVNCHSCINEDVWTLNTTVFSSSEINRDKLKIIKDEDPEICALMWTMETAKILQSSGYKYNDALKAMEDRLEKVK